MSTVIAFANAEGLADGQSLVAPVSGSGGTGGTDFNNHNPGTGNTPTASATVKMHGTRGYRIDQAGATSSTLGWSAAITGRPLSQVAARGYFYLPNVPTGNGLILQGFTNTDFTGQEWAVRIAATTGRVNLNSGTATVYTSTAALTGGNWYRAEVQLVSATSARLCFYLGDSSVPSIDSGTITWASTVSTQSFRFGWVGAASGLPYIGFDDVAIGSGTGFLPPPAGVTYTAPANVPPTVNAGTSQYVQAGATITLNGSATDSDGTIASATWSVLSVPDGASTPSIASPANLTGAQVVLASPGRYRFKLTVVDNNGGTGEGIAEEYVYPASDADVLVYDAPTASNWSVTGAANAKAALNDTSAATYTESSSNPVAPGVSRTDTMNPYGPGDIKVYTSGYRVGSAITLRVEVLTEDESQVIYTEDIPLTTTDTEYEVKVNAAGLAVVPGLSERRALRVRQTAIAV